MKRLQRRLSKKQKGSKNRLKAKTKLANLHEKLANRREHDIQTITASLARQYQNIVLETLNVKGMMKNHKLAGALSDASLFRFKSELKRKVLERKGTVEEVNQWFPSSKLCSNCGVKNNTLSIKDRNWTCNSCGVSHDRDINAALNLKNSVRPSRPEFKPVEILKSSDASHEGIQICEAGSNDVTFKRE